MDHSLTNRFHSARQATVLKDEVPASMMGPHFRNVETSNKAEKFDPEKNNNKAPEAEKTIMEDQKSHRIDN